MGWSIISRRTLLLLGITIDQVYKVILENRKQVFVNVASYFRLLLIIVILFVVLAVFRECKTLTQLVISLTRMFTDIQTDRRTDTHIHKHTQTHIHIHT